MLFACKRIIAAISIEKYFATSMRVIEEKTTETDA
jgi:hypothetical protein